jgi:hypothetical protein
MLNSSAPALNNEVIVAKRAAQKPATNMKMSLLVSSQPAAQSRGQGVGQVASQIGNAEQQVVSPYLKARNAPNASFTSAGDQQAALQSANPVHFQATLPPSDGKWAR